MPSYYVQIVMQSRDKTLCQNVPYISKHIQPSVPRADWRLSSAILGGRLVIIGKVRREGMLICVVWERFQVHFAVYYSLARWCWHFDSAALTEHIHLKGQCTNNSLVYCCTITATPSLSTISCKLHLGVIDSWWFQWWSWWRWRLFPEEVNRLMLWKMLSGPTVEESYRGDMNNTAVLDVLWNSIFLGLQQCSHKSHCTCRAIIWC